MTKRKSKTHKPKESNDGIFVASGEDKREPIFTKKGLTVIVFLGVLLVVASIYYFALGPGSKKEEQETQKVCTNSFVNESLPGIQDKNFEEVVATITSIDNYQTDVDCVYIVLLSEIFDGNNALAKEKLDEVKKLVNGGQKIDNDLILFGNPETLESQILTIEKNIEEQSVFSDPAVEEVPDDYQ